MASLVVILVVLGCAAGLYFKGTVVRSFAMIIAAICASIVAFAYFESLAAVLIGKDLIVPWAQAASFILLFVIASAVLQTAVIMITRKAPVDLGFLPERIGCVACGFFLGLIISGFLITAIAMMPLSGKIPYQRFDAVKPNIENPSGTLFNADGFATGCFNLVSSGSFSSEKSFAVLHANFLDQLFWNRYGISDDVVAITDSQAIELRKKTTAWMAPESLRGKDPNEPIEPKSEHALAIVRVGIKKSAKDADKFTLSQLRQVCKPKDSPGPKLSGKGTCVYPIGYVKKANQLEMKKLNEVIQIPKARFTGKVKWIDFAFYVPNGFVPVLVEFKQNSILKLPAIVSADKAPTPVSF